MLLVAHSAINTTLGYDATTTEMAKKFMTNHGQKLKESLFDGENGPKYDEEMAYMGIS